jgi:4-hydroxyphenylpyruvate dioxygenase
VVREADPGETALDAYRSLLFLQDELGRLPHPAGRARVGVRSVPSPPASVDTAFVELAVGVDAGPAARLLTGLGFTPAGEHVSKPVTWWRNGDAHVVVNRGEGRAGEVRPVAVGVVAAPVTDVVARARALCWPEVTRRRSTEEARLPALTSPAGVHLLVSEGPGRQDHWQRDFVAVDDPSPPSTWCGIDHVGTAVDEAHLNAETSFHRGLFAFEPGPVSEFMEPHGRLRSRVLRPRAGNVRMVLSVADTREAAPRGINQVAFRCDDVRAEVRRLRALGADLVDVPDNYYADLEARFALSPEEVAELREHGLLYDRDGDGELLHTYTPLVDGRFYVELLERRGGYQGFGSANTAVRLALQTSPRRPTDSRT